MKVLLLNPPATMTVQEYKSEKQNGLISTEDFGAFPPLGLLYIAASLEEKLGNGGEILVLDCAGEKLSHEALLAKATSFNPDLIGIGSFTLSLLDVIAAASALKKALPCAHICIGGHHPLHFPMETLSHTCFDSIFIGEGELSFPMLAKCLAEKKDIANIPGLLIARHLAENSESPNKRMNTTPACIDNLDVLPFPARKKLRHVKYHSVLGCSNDLATIISSRGCPFKCIFCDVPYKKYRPRSIDNVVDEIEECLEMGFKEFHFYDDLFNITPKRVIDFCKELKRRSINVPWDFRGRVNTADMDSLKMAAKCGCRLASFGVETGTDEGLSHLQKGTSIAQVKNVFSWCKSLGIRTVADYMIGLPTEKSKDDVKENIEFLISLDPDYAQISILSIYPGTELHSNAVTKGLLPNDKWSSFAQRPQKDFTVDYWTEYLTPDELLELQSYAYRRFYLRPSYIIKSLFNTHSLYEFKTKAHSALKLLSSK